MTPRSLDTANREPAHPEAEGEKDALTKAPEDATKNASTKTTAEQDPAGKRKSRERFSRRTTLWIVLVGVLVITPFAAWAFQLDYISGQVGVVAAVSAVALYFSAQLLRYRLRISLRTLLIIMAVIAVGLGLVGRRLAESRRETNAVEQLTSLGAQVTFDGDRSAHGDAEYFKTDNGWYLPVWVREGLGESFFSQVSEIRLSRSRVQDRHLQFLTDVRHAESLQFATPGITAKGLATLPVIPGVSHISLDWFQVSKASMARLREFKSLKNLHIAYPPGNVVSPLARLDLLAGFGQLESVTVSVDVVDAEGIKALANLPNLDSLSIGAPGWPSPLAMGDASALAEIAKSKSINYLWLNVTEFSPAELNALQGLPSLRHLMVNGSSLDDVALESFRKARPDVTLRVIK